MKRIDKDKVVEEIRRYKRNAELYIEHHKGENSKLYHSFELEKDTMCELLSFIDTLEVKEVDLVKEIQQHINDCLNIKFPTTDIKMIAKDVEYTARKFFELGLKAKGAEGICKTSETEYPNFDEAQGTPITR